MFLNAEREGISANAARPCTNTASSLFPHKRNTRPPQSTAAQLNVSDSLSQRFTATACLDIARRYVCSLLSFCFSRRVKDVAFTAKGGWWRESHSPLRESRCVVHTHKRSVLTVATRPPASPRSSRRQASTAAPQPRSAARCPPPHLPGTTRRVANLCIATADAINRKRPEGWGMVGGAALRGSTFTRWVRVLCATRHIHSQD